MREIQEQVIFGKTLYFRENPFLVEPDDSFVFHERGALAVQKDGKIGWHGPREQLPAEYRQWQATEFENCLIIPGFVDAHIHFPQYRMIAAYGKDLLDWLNRYTFVEEQLYSDTGHSFQAAGRFLDELLRHGITSALVFSTIHPTALDALFTEAENRNMQIVSGKTLMDRNAPDGLCDKPESDYEECKSLIGKWNGRSRLSYAVSPRFAVTSSERQLEVAGALVKEHPDLLMQTHLSENADEIKIVAKDFSWSKDYTDVYDRFGLLGPNSVFAHCIHLSERELERLRESESAVIHCPTSNSFLGSGLFCLKRTQNCLHANKLGIGSDVGGGTGYSTLQTLGEAYKVSQLTGQRITAIEGFFLATLGNAQVLGIDNHVGTLEAGSFADLAVLDPCATPLMRSRNELSDSLHDLLFALMFLGDDRAVRETFVAGQPLKSLLGN